MSNSDYALQVRSKIWLEVNGEPVFGKGREELLRLIQNGNSINASSMIQGNGLIRMAPDASYAKGDEVEVILLDRGFEMGEALPD